MTEGEAKEYKRMLEELSRLQTEISWLRLMYPLQRDTIRLLYLKIERLDSPLKEVAEDGDT